MIPIIISCIALVFSIIALIKAFWKKEKIEIKVNDDLTGIEDVALKARGIKILTIKDRDKQIEWHLKNDFAKHEDDFLKDEYKAGYRQCWNWLKDNKMI